MNFESISKFLLRKPMLSKNSRFIFGFLSILVAAIGLSYLFWVQQNQFKPKNFKIYDKSPDFLIQKASYTQFSGTSGQLEFKMKASELRHYESLNRTEFEAPSLNVYNDIKNSWLLQADSAWMLNFDNYQNNQSNEHQLITFENNVLLTSNGEKPLQLDTHFLEINPRLKTIQTPSHVQIQSSQFTLKSDGFKTQLNAGILEFNDQVKVTYFPKPTAHF